MAKRDWPAGEAAFITGGASGIGLGIARALVAAGAKVALADIDEDGLAAAAEELSCAAGVVTTVKLDIGDSDAWEAAADAAERAIGPISILCNNAGVSGGVTIEQTPLEIWRWVQRINTEAQFIGISTFLPRFRTRSGRAHILNTASMAGLLPFAGGGAYTASKFASVGLSMVLREELRNSDIRVSLLCPGTVATRLSETASAAEAEVLGHEPDTTAAERVAEMLAQGADPNAVGEQVVEAMADDQFLIITHREWGPVVAELHSEVEQAFTDFDGRHGHDPVAEMMASGVNPAMS
ncbi:putative oxidoreductase, SDR-family [Nocardia nova SH22a]|uniref:Putative oxidoreductase, SDR-family n=2 Tax=Nocardia nova TaxID=37330 RepID=W5TM43_9NOCA|nr:putative oxidoreductase, SDR-family [Nocardia nova SH22a]